MDGGKYTQLGLRKFPRNVAREVKKAAAHRGVTLTEFMVTAATRALRNQEGSPDYSELERDIAWYERNRQRLAVRYGSGTNLAIVDEEVVAHDDDSTRLAGRMRERYGRRPLFMPCLGGVPAPLRRMRSPRRVR